MWKQRGRTSRVCQECAVQRRVSSHCSPALGLHRAPHGAAQALQHLSRHLHWPPKDSSCKPWQEELVLSDIQTSTSLPFQHNPPKGSDPPSSQCLLNTRTDFSWNAHSSTCWHPAPRQTWGASSVNSPSAKTAVNMYQSTFLPALNLLFSLKLNGGWTWSLVFQSASIANSFITFFPDMR